MPEKLFLALTDFLSKWFQSFKDFTYKVSVDNPVDNSKKLDDIKEAITSLTFPEPIEPKPFPTKMDVDIKNWPKEKEKDGPEEVKVSNWPKLPEFKFKLPDIFKIKGEVKADVEFPETQKIEGKVDVDFPKTQQISGNVSINQFEKLIGGFQVVVDMLREQALEFDVLSRRGQEQITAMTMGSRKNLSLISDDENKLDISPDGHAYVRANGIASEEGANTESDITGDNWSDDTFTGTGEQNGYDHVGVSLTTDEVGVLHFDFSVDGTNWSQFPVNGFKVASGIHEFHTAVKLGRYFRVRFVGEGGRTYFRLFTYYSNNFVPSVAPLNQTAGLDQDAIFTRSTLPQDEIRIGRRAGVTGWNKFGYREGLTAAGGEEQIWATTGNFTPLASAETFDIAYDGTGGGSTDGAGTTGATELTFYYIDSDGNEAIATHTLGTDGDDTTSFSGLGINRVAVSATGTNDTNVSDITVTATTAGTKQAVVPAGGGVTQQAIFFVGSNHTAVAKYLFIDISSSAKTPVVLIKGYVYNRAVDSRYEVFRTKIDTSVELHRQITEPIGFNLNPTDVLYFVADSDSNSVDIVLRFSLNHYQNM